MLSAASSGCFVSDGVHRLSGGSDFGETERINPSACLDCAAVRCFGAQPFRAQIHFAPLFGINRHPLVLATPLHIPRRTCCRDEYGATKAGLSGRAVLLCSLRLVPVCLFRFGVSETRLIFPVAKVGLTVHRKTSILIST